MPVLSEYDDLLVFPVRAFRIKFLLDAFLQAQDHRTGGIDDFYIVLPCLLVGLRRFAVGSEQYFHVVKPSESFMVDGDKSEFFQPFAFLSVVYDVAQAL